MCYWYFQQIYLIYSIKDKKGITTSNAFQKNLDKSNRKTNKIWVEKGSKCYNRSINFWLEKNAEGMYPAHNGGNSAVAGRFIRKIKKEIYKYMTWK